MNGKAILCTALAVVAASVPIPSSALTDDECQELAERFGLVDTTRITCHYTGGVLILEMIRTAFQDTVLVLVDSTGVDSTGGDTGDADPGDDRLNLAFGLSPGAYEITNEGNPVDTATVVNRSAVYDTPPGLVGVRRLP